MLKKSVKSIAISLLFVSLFVSCASLPRATVDLSMLLEKQISALEQSHIKLINKYFEEKQ